jgi:putative FmdB family regulatory protein
VPTYQYACTACGEQLEVVQKFTDDPLTVCPACEGRLRKVFSAVGVVFKGSGFYRTDSRVSANGGAKNGKSTESPGAGSDTSDSGAASSANSDASSSSSSGSSSSSSGSSSTGSSSAAKSGSTKSGASAA